jgi:ABC-type dipeptide/oligopeptide/nickel transport system permease subunit
MALLTLALIVGAALALGATLGRRWGYIRGWSDAMTEMIAAAKAIRAGKLAEAPPAERPAA